MDKNQATIDFLLQCSDIASTPLYFNLASGRNGITQLIKLTDDVNITKPFIDGSVQKRYSLTIISFLTISQNPLVKQPGFDNENVSDMESVQKLIDWIAEQNKIRNFPDFGDDCIIDRIITTTLSPRIDQIDTTQSNPLARYSFTIQIEYVDNTDRNY